MDSKAIYHINSAWLNYIGLSLLKGLGRSSLENLVLSLQKFVNMSQFDHWECLIGLSQSKWRKSVLTDYISDEERLDFNGIQCIPLLTRRIMEMGGQVRLEQDRDVIDYLALNCCEYISGVDIYSKDCNVVLLSSPKVRIYSHRYKQLLNYKQMNVNEESDTERLIARDGFAGFNNYSDDIAQIFDKTRQASNLTDEQTMLANNLKRCFKAHG